MGPLNLSPNYPINTFPNYPLPSNSQTQSAPNQLAPRPGQLTITAANSGANPMPAQSEVPGNYRNPYHSGRGRVGRGRADYQHSNSYGQNNYNGHNNNGFNCQYPNSNYQATGYPQAQSAYNAGPDFPLDPQAYGAWNYHGSSDAPDQDGYYPSDDRESQDPLNVDSNPSDEEGSENRSLEDQTANYTEAFLVERIP